MLQSTDHNTQWATPYPNDRFNILFVDDHPFVIDTVSDVLKSANYNVFAATNLDDALALIGEQHLHLGIFDIELEMKDNSVNNNNPLNFDGLNLAVRAPLPHIRMIHTVHDKINLVMKAMEHPQVVDYTLKGEDGGEGLLIKVNQALTNRLELNQDLLFDWGSVSLQALVKAIYPRATMMQQMGKVLELEDLFRMYFYAIDDHRVNQISVSRLTDDKDGRVWLKVRAYADDLRYDYLLVVGQGDYVEDEAKYFEKYAHRSGQIQRRKPLKTVHFGMNGYEVFDNSLREIHPMTYYLHANDDDFITQLLNKLHSERFHQRFHQTNKPHLHGELYTLATGKPTELHTVASRLWDIAKRIAQEWQYLMPDALMDVSKQELLYNIGRDQRYPHPAVYMEKIGSMMVKRRTDLVHGDLRFETIFVSESDGEIYLTDYANVREASVLRDYVTLERSIHVALISQIDLDEYQTLAHVLNTLDDDSVLNNFSSILRSAAEHIRHIRQMAMRYARANLDDYLQDLYIDFINYLQTYPDRPFVGYEAIRPYVHCLLFAGQICSDLEQQGVVLDEQLTGDGIWLDDAHNRVRILGQSVPLTPNQFGIFRLLYTHVEQRCTYQDIIEKGWGQEMRHGHIEIEKPRVQTAISRLRQVLKPFDFVFENVGDGYILHRDN